MNKLHPIPTASGDHGLLTNKDKETYTLIKFIWRLQYWYQLGQLVGYDYKVPIQTFTQPSTQQAIKSLVISLGRFGQEKGNPPHPPLLMVNKVGLAWYVQWDAAHKGFTEDVYGEEEKDPKPRKKTINMMTSRSPCAVPNRCSISLLIALTSTHHWRDAFVAISKDGQLSM